MISLIKKICYLFRANRNIFISEGLHSLFINENDILILDIIIPLRKLFVFSKQRPNILANDIKKTKKGFLYYISFQDLLENPSIVKGKILNRFFLLSKVKEKTVLDLFDYIYPNEKIPSLFVFTDRDDHADDNAEHLLKYITTYRVDLFNDKFFYYLNNNKNSNVDIEKIRVPLSDKTYKTLLKHASVFLSSQVDFNKLSKLSVFSKFVFLQHGVTQNNISSWLNCKKIDLIVTSTILEHKSIVDEMSPYKITERNAILSGLPRFDYLYLNKEKFVSDSVVIAPTWRQYPSKSQEMLLYINTWKDFLLSNVLKEVSLENNIVFIVHPKMRDYLSSGVQLPSYIKFKEASQSYSSIFLKARLLITDYSSISFDMAYLHKNTIYYQFDRDCFFSSGVIKGSSDSGFDYYRHGFGPVCHTLEEVSDALKYFNDNKLSDMYRSRFDMNFKYIDGGNSKRLVNKVFDSGWYL